MPDTDSSHIFVYGTLLVPDIWNAVTGFPELSSKKAALHHHRIAKVRGGDFPVLAESPEATGPVHGRLYFSVPQAALDRLDSYEDRFYRRVSVEVDCEGEAIPAEVYRVPPGLVSEVFSNEAWTLDWFLENAMDRYWRSHFG